MRAFARPWALGAVVLAVAGLAAVASGTLDSGIRGKVTIGPTCPVERYPPDPQCAPKPYDAAIRVRRNSDHRLVARTRSGSDGRFRVRLRRGRYTVYASSPRGSAYPMCRPVPATVRRDRFTRVAISCDSGIR